MRSRDCQEGNGDDATLRLVLDHAAELLRFARRFSHCADDAHDAYQRAVEVLVRRMRVDPPAQPLSWMRTVLRHEALAVRREREQLVGHAEIDLDRHEDRAVADPAEQAVGHERLRHTAEALRRLKPQEATALVLRAEGLSYSEICSRTGWTYTKTNRCVTEGRRALLKRLGAIESGAECDHWLPLLSSVADGEATARELADLRPHLRSCAACRATLRDFHAAPARVAMLVPPAVVELATGPAHDSLLGHAGLALHALLERATLLATRVQGAFEAVPGTKLAAVAASTAVFAGGGTALREAAHAGSGPRAGSVVSAGPSAVALDRLTPIALPVRPPAARRGISDRNEFASEPPTGSGPARHAAARAEFADASRSSAPSPAPAAAAAFAPSAPPDPSPRPTAPSEFGGP
jgi:RNA polymerase sigma factor (sigma-70 family)